MIFTEDQINSLNLFQRCGMWHPFTCANGHGPLLAKAEGWVCESCDYVQTWAHQFMVDWEWKRILQQSPMHVAINQHNEDLLRLNKNEQVND